MMMWCTALTGISPSVIEELKQGKARTLELSSAHNIISLTDAAQGECLFMTSIDLEDLTSGDSGILVDLLSLNISMKRIIEFVNPAYFEERERMAARIKVRYAGSTMARAVEGREWGKPTKVDIIRAPTYRAG